MKSEECSQKFTVIAPYYDTLMSFINYSAWVLYIERILELNKVEEKTILDLACGTGVCIRLWLEKGYKVIGLDNSLSMLKVCQEKISPMSVLIGNDIQLINGDMRNFPLTEKIPIITCLYDSLNYLLTEEDILDCFKNAYDVLTDDGIFIFDMNTIHSLRDEWGNRTFHRQDADIHSVWANTFDPNTYISSLNITLNIRKDGRVTTIKEFHQERGYPLSLIRDLLSKAGFKSSLYRHLTFIPAQERDMRIMGVARR
jgi:ubiquinone/menaquinone biosynthesis C-methylase UbiE